MIDELSLPSLLSSLLLVLSLILVVAVLGGGVTVFSNVLVEVVTAVAPVAAVVAQV